ncbi:hypothetical protein LWI29_035046 [Acer saccharum]|uniref:Uncharacterized protein n=1 Tax=Acer saccharum TaxID=4024 RepID=A0AA39SWF3_ACESA|nr:hypothetical protein LWI29_035046 [Acer saccharum]
MTKNLELNPQSCMLQMTNEAKDTALHEAVRYNHLDVVQLLTKENPSLPYDANTAGETPLYLAAERGYAKVLKEILGTSNSPADHGPYDRTAMHVAIIRNDMEITKLLLDDRRIQKIRQDQQGWTPLHFATYLGYTVIAKKLIIEDKSAAYKADYQGKTALHVAAGLGRVTIMRELISSCPGCCELVDNRGWNVLHFASTSRNSNAIKLILRNPSLGNLVNEKDEKGNTPFLQAASMRFIINHPKVDNLVFNNDNHNAADVLVNPLTHIYPWKLRESISWNLIKLKIIRCWRFMLAVDNDEGGKEDKGDSVLSSNSKGNGDPLLKIITLLSRSKSNVKLLTTLARSMTLIIMNNLLQKKNCK